MKVVKLGDIAEIIAGQSPASKSYNKEGIGMPFFQGKTDFAVKYPQVRNWCSMPVKIALKNDILISVRAPVGPVNICNVDKACIGRGLSAIRMHPGYDNEYIYYFLKYNEANIVKLGVGSTFEAITQRDLINLLIKIPDSYIEQVKISTILSKVEFLIQKRQESITLLDELVNSVFNRLFGDPVKNEKKWRTAILQDLCTKIGSGATPRGGKQNYKQEGISLIRSLNVYNGRFEYKDLAFIDEEQAKSLDNVIVEEDDVLLTITGASVARSCIVPTDILPARVNQHVSIIRTDKEKINSVFLNYTLINKNYQVLLLKIAKLNGATREALTKEDVCSLIISLPPLPLQNQFAEIVQKTEIIKQRFQKSLEELNHLYQSLSQRAFQGKLDLSRLDVEEELEEFQEKQQIKMRESVENMLLSDSAVYYDVPRVKEPADKLSQSVSEFSLLENTAGREKGYRLFNIEQIAESIKKRYTGFHFSFEMLYRFLSRVLFLDVPYYSSEELKKRPSLNSEQDIRWFIHSAIVNVDRGENERRLLNPFIRLEQHFYNAEKENMTLRLVDEDYQLLRKRNKKERSGIYFSIKES